MRTTDEQIIKVLKSDIKDSEDKLAELGTTYELEVTGKSNIAYGEESDTANYEVGRISGLKIAIKLIKER